MKRSAPSRASLLSPLELDHEFNSDDDDSTDMEGLSVDEKIVRVKKQLQQVVDKVHPEYLKAKSKSEAWLSEEKRRARIVYENKNKIIQQQYDDEIKACSRDCEIEKKRIQEHLIALCQDVKRRLEHDKKNIELTPSGDILDLKPTVTRKLRRRGATANDYTTPSSSVFGNNLAYWNDFLLVNLPVNNSHQPTTTSNIAPDDAVLSLDPAVDRKPSSSSNLKPANAFGSLGWNLLETGMLSNFLMSAYKGVMPRTSTTANTASSSTDSSSTPNTAASLLLLSLAQSAATSSSTSGGANQSTGGGSKTRRRQLGGVGPPPPPAAQLGLMLTELDLLADLAHIHKACNRSGTSTSVANNRKPAVNQQPSSPPLRGGGSPLSGGNTVVGNSSSSTTSSGGGHKRDSPASLLFGSGSPPPPSSSQAGSGSISAWIDDGRLYYKSRCYQTGGLVILEGREGVNNRCMGSILHITAQDIAIRRHSDHGMCRVSVQQLKQGRYALWPPNS